MKIVSILIAGLYWATTALAQDGETAKRDALKKAADQMNYALVNRKFDLFVKTAYPKAITTVPGGAEKMIERLKTQMAAMDQQGHRIVAAWIGEPTAFIDTAGELQCTVNQKMALQFEQGKLITETTLLALSPDDGVTWYFVDAADRDIQKMRTIFPTLSSKLVLNPSPEPVFEKTPEKAPEKKAVPKSKK